MKFPTMEEWAKDVAEMALDEWEYKGKTLRQWVEIILATDINVATKDGTNLAEVGTDVPDINVGELISKEQAIDALRGYLVGKRCPDDGTLTCRLIENEVINKLPSIQPKRGKWIHHPEIGWGETWLCDRCGEKTTSTVMGKPRANFCPNCGADMRGEQDG